MHRDTFGDSRGTDGAAPGLRGTRRLHAVHLESGRAQRREAARTDESAGARHQHSVGAAHGAVEVSSRGKAASRSAMCRGTSGQSIASAGSFQRTPRANPGAYATDIM